MCERLGIGRLCAAWLIAFLSAAQPAQAADGAEDSKPPYENQIARAVVHLREHRILCEGGNPIQAAIGRGTGFFVARWTEGRGHIYLITSRHVTAEGRELYGVVRDPAKPDSEHLMHLPPELWVHHPEPGPDGEALPIDVAAMRIPYAHKLFYFSYCPEEECTTVNGEPVQNQLPAEDPPILRIAAFAGFPAGEVASHRSEPFARSGVIAYRAIYWVKQIIVAGRSVPFADERLFAVDAPSFPGDSGSPVMKLSLPLGGSTELWGLVTGSATKGRDYAIVTPVSRIRETLDEAERAGTLNLMAWEDRLPSVAAAASTPNPCIR